MEINFDKLYKISEKAMRLNRTHPEVPRDLKWVLEFCVMHLAFTLVYCIVVYNVIISIAAGDYSEACRNGIFSVIHSVVSFQYFILVFNQDTIMKIMNMIKDDFKKDLTHDEKKIVLEYAEKGSKVARHWLKVAFITAATFPIKHIILELHTCIKGEFELLMIYPLTFPSPIEENKYHPVLYTLIYVLIMFYALYGMCMYVSFVPLGPSYMLHACGQLEIVKKRTLELYANVGEEDPKIELIAIVKHLQYIYHFVDCIKDAFRMVYEITLRGSNIVLPITFYEVVSGFHKGEFSIEFIMFIIAGTLICGIPCYYGDVLMEKGEDVRLAIYSCGWETVYDHQSRKTILIIQQRALQPMSIRTLFRTVCLDAFADLLQQSYALFNLMNATWG